MNNNTIDNILHKHITYGEGFDAYIVDDIDALRSDLATFEQETRIDEWQRFIDFESGENGRIAQLTKELESLEGK